MDSRLDNWLANLDEKQIVIHYDPKLGMQWAARRSWDTDVIRRREDVGRLA